ncbi:hypothetical protein GCM10023235_52740 [Kitasatospora terrestris]|uniref:Uncharacterized protein n=1 Tax=Kitasatospora terrestris TaxID=258051 RepID=A0ABP9E8Y1_9ACTN
MQAVARTARQVVETRAADARRRLFLAIWGLSWEYGGRRHGPSARVRGTGAWCGGAGGASVGSVGGEERVPGGGEGALERAVQDG